ncbi:MAG: TadE/TadG family type IV pilus assembly protein [Alphaproteobacteria bacterium]
MSELSLPGRLPRALRRLAREEDGGILVETAFVMPILLTLLLGSVEVGRYIIVNQKLERAASSVADLVAQSNDTVSLEEIQTLFGIVPHIVSPYDIVDNGRVIITAVTRGDDESDEPVVAWQIDGLGTLDGVSSVIGGVGDTANLPDGFVLPTGETIIVGEAWYDYDAYFFESIDPTGPMYHRAYYRPRLASLSQTPESEE